MNRIHMPMLTLKFIFESKLSLVRVNLKHGEKTYYILAKVQFDFANYLFLPVVFILLITHSSVLTEAL